MASDKNELIIEGNMVRDPALSSTSNGTSLCKFSIASNRFFKKGDGFDKETSFLDVICWAALALDVADHGKKGLPVKITGHIKQDRWEYNGKQQSKIIVVAENVEFLNRGRQNNRDYQDYPQIQEHQETGGCPF